MEQLQHTRPRPRIPAVQCGTGSSGRRVDRHLAVLGAPALSAADSAAAASLIRELTPRGVNIPQTPEAEPSRGSKVSLLAPLRRLRRGLFGGLKRR